MGRLRAPVPSPFTFHRSLFTLHPLPLVTRPPRGADSASPRNRTVPERNPSHAAFSRSVGREHPALPRRGRGGEGPLRAPGDAHGRRGHGPRAVDPLPQVRPSAPEWADRDRFVLSAGPRLHAALRAAAPGGLRAEPRRSPQLPAVGVRDRPATRSRSSPRASRPPPDPWGRGVSAAVGHGDRGAAPGGPLQPPRLARGRPPHLGHRRATAT